jgi:tetratricopeptide (TPR) repeat protein
MKTSTPAVAVVRPLCSRRLLLVNGSSLPLLSCMPSLAAGQSVQLVQRGVQLFASGAPRLSVAAFDAAIGLEPALAEYLWQRGLALYYAGEYVEGARQFRRDVARNPNDTEEALWCFLCEAAQAGGSLDQARRQLLTVGRDSRDVLRVAYNVFAGCSALDDLRAFRSGVARDAFYASLYEGLYLEAEGDVAASKSAIDAACESAYAQHSADYMVTVARVHRQLRGGDKLQTFLS